MNDIDLPWSFFNMHGLFNGQISFLKAGFLLRRPHHGSQPNLRAVNTQPEFGLRMEGLLQQRHHEGRLSGILNGVDEQIWNPETDLLLAAHGRDPWRTKRRTSVSY